ncbi:MAG: energy transducer TonB [Bacteroidetes bacterium]|nr:energy transducer TonB [Bacteroidota bacterium]
MRSIWIFIFLSGISKQSFATDTLKCPGGYFDSTLSMNVYDFAEVEPSYPGGFSEMVTFINQNLVYPESARNVCGSSKVFVEFVVSAEGKILNLEVVKSEGKFFMEEMETEVLRVLALMPDWIPGICNGNKVAVKYRIPVKVEID